MEVDGASVLVTGGASGLGLATAEKMAAAGASVTIFDLPQSDGERRAGEIERATFAPGDVTSEADFAAALDQAEAAGQLRAVIHCAGRGSGKRVVGRDGVPMDQDFFEEVIRVNLSGTFNVLRLSAARMATNDVTEDDRGAVVLTASVAAFEGQVGQSPYAASKAGIVGLTLCAARDLAPHRVRVCSIAPGIFDTPLLGRLPEEVRASLGESVPHPRRLGRPEEFGRLALQIVENGYLNGETLRLDGAIRMAPR